MAAERSKSELGAKYGKALDNAVKTHANDATIIGRIDLPPNISNGIAQVSKCYFKKYTKDTNQKMIDGKTSAEGEFFFRMEATIHTPKIQEYEGQQIPTGGQTTSVMIPMIDTKTQEGKVTTQEDQVSKVLNEFRKLMGDDFTKHATGNDLEAMAAQIEQEAPYTWFATSPKIAQQDGNGHKKGDVIGCWENWKGNKGLEDYQPEDATKAMKGPSTDIVSNGVKPNLTVDTKSKETPIAEESLETLVALANADVGNSEEAKQELQNRALALGYSQAELDDDETGWEDIKNMIENPKTNEDSNVPKEGGVYKYSPPSKKNPGKFLEARDCQVVGVDNIRAVASLKDLSNKNEYKDVPFDKLS